MSQVIILWRCLFLIIGYWQPRVAKMKLYEHCWESLKILHHSRVLPPLSYSPYLLPWYSLSLHQVNDEYICPYVSVNTGNISNLKIDFQWIIAWFPRGKHQTFLRLLVTVLENLEERISPRLLIICSLSCSQHIATYSDFSARYSYQG